MSDKEIIYNPSDIAYIAGLFDGEGCVTCKEKLTKRKDRKNKVYKQWYIRCELAMTDKDTVGWLHNTLGFGWCKEKRYNNKPNYRNSTNNNVQTGTTGNTLTTPNVKPPIPKVNIKTKH